MAFDAGPLAHEKVIERGLKRMGVIPLTNSAQDRLRDWRRFNVLIRKQADVRRDVLGSCLDGEESKLVIERHDPDRHCEIVGKKAVLSLIEFGVLVSVELVLVHKGSVERPGGRARSVEFTQAVY